MENKKVINNSLSNPSNTFNDYISLIRTNIYTILIISFVFLVGAIAYALFKNDVYQASTTLKITQNKQNILKGPSFDDLTGTGGNNFFIANEIETIRNVTIREQVAGVVLDSFQNKADKENYDVVFRKNSFFDDSDKKIRTVESLAGALLKSVEITQKNNLNFMEIMVESESPEEAAMIANSYAEVYRNFNLLENRKQFTIVKDFLNEQKEQKYDELLVAEENIKVYQANSGGIELNSQAKAMINTLTKFESDKNITQMEIAIERKKLNEFKNELSERDPSLSNYFDLQSARPSIEMLQKEIASIETQKAIALSGKGSREQKNTLVKGLDQKLGELRKKLKTDIDAYESKVYAATPEEVKELSAKIFESEVKIQSLAAKNSQLSQVLNSYESEFQSLPAKSLEIARLERKRQSLEKMYLVLEDKYQEALLNEQSIPGNVLILSKARAPESPAEPNRLKIAIMGLFAGLFFAVVFVYVKSFFDKTVKTPDDLENLGLYVLGSVPRFERKVSSEGDDSEIFMSSKNEIAASEAYRAMRTRIQFSKLSEGTKAILITSSAPQEGKTTVTVNLAAGFAQTNKKVIILDCDLRIPRIHSVFKGKSSPGFTNFLFGQVSFDEIVRKSNEVDNLYYIAAGTIPSNPSEILGSKQLEDFLKKLKSEFDLVILDAPPVMTITDAEILSHIVDITLLVVFANKTEVDWVTESAQILNRGEESSFVGAILNNFDYNTGYRSYHKYNSNKYYRRADESRSKEWVKS